MNSRFIRFLIFAFLILPILSFSQTDNEFWFAAPAVTHQFVPPSPVIYQNLNHPIRLYFTTPDSIATATIDQPANPSFIPITVTIHNTVATMVDLTGFIDSIENKPANTILNRGLHITSVKPISVSYEVVSPFNAETWALLGRNALGYEFIIPAQNHYDNYKYADPPARNTFEIVATEDSTTVTIVPKQNIEGHFANDTFAIMMNRGQTWSGRASSADSSAHLGGSFVFSDKPVTVSMSDDALLIPSSQPNSIDIAGCQLIPRHIAGTKYLLRCQWGDSLSHRDRIFVYAFNDSTQITFNDSISIITRAINRGESTEFIFNIPDTITMAWMASIISNKPVLVYHFTMPDQTWNYPLTRSAQAASAIVPPMQCGGSKRVCFTVTPPHAVNNFFVMNIVTHNGNQGGFQFVPSYINPSTWAPIPGTNGEWIETGLYFGNFYLGFTVLVTNNKGRFQLSILTSCPARDTISFGKFSYVTDFGTLNLGTDRKICPGDSTLLDAGFGRDSYIWNTGDTTQTIWVKTPGMYWVSTTEVGGCNLSDTINISYYFTTPVNLGPDKQICDGDSILLNAGAGRSWYYWSTGDSTQTIWVKSSGIYWVKVPDVHCIVSDTVMVSLTPPPEITNNPLSKTICSGESTNITLTSNLPGATFHWTATLTSGNITGYSADSGLIINQVLVNSLSTAGIVTYHITPKAGTCAGTAVDFPVTVNAGDSVKVNISASTNNICAGTPVTFIAIVTNGGSSPSYLWKVNGISIGPDNSVFSYSPDNGDVVTCILTSSNTVCTSNNPATSNIITMVVYPLLPISVSISPSANPVCEGTSVTFTATPRNGGSLPFYQWKVNGINAGINNTTYSYIPNNGDVVSCVLTSNILCPSGNPATSNTITMTINPNVPVSIIISASANPFCPGNSITFTATPANGGINPSYQWKVNGVNVGTNSSTYSYNPLNGDSVRCVMTSNLTCVSGNPAYSNKIIMSGTLASLVTYTLCNDSITTTSAKPFKLKGAIPLGGTYSGPGVTNGIFYPAIAGVGNHQITYTYTNAALCSAAAIVTIVTIVPTVTNCGQILTDIRDGKTYPTVQIGSQCWMAANLNYGTLIPGNTSQRDNCIPEKYCPNDLTADCGLLTANYQWDELMQYDEVVSTQGLCPPGWHVPTEVDWNTLFANYISNAFAASPLKYSGFSGFNALLSGARHLNKTWDYQGFATFFWSSTSHGINKAWVHGMNDADPSVSLYPAFRSNAFSVRCLKDN